MGCRHRSDQACVSVHVHAHRTCTHNHHTPPPGQSRVGKIVRVAGTRAAWGRSEGLRRKCSGQNRARWREGGSVGPEPTLNRRSMGHTLEENGKWGSSRGWPGKDGIPPYAFSLSFSLSLGLGFGLALALVLFLAFVSSPPLYSMLSCCLILPLPPAGPAAHPPSPTPSFLRYLISFSHPSLTTSVASPHRTDWRRPRPSVLRSQSRTLRRRHANEGYPATGQVCEP